MIFALFLEKTYIQESLWNLNGRKIWLMIH